MGKLCFTTLTTFSLLHNISLYHFVSLRHGNGEVKNLPLRYYVSFPLLKCWIVGPNGGGDIINIMILIRFLSFRGIVNHSGIKASISMTQKSPYDVTFVSYRFLVPPPEGVLGNIKIHELPPRPNVEGSEMCEGIRGVYNPANKEFLDAGKL